VDINPEADPALVDDGQELSKVTSAKFDPKLFSVHFLVLLLKTAVDNSAPYNVVEDPYR
jgi:hypothetical protein